MTRTHPTDYAFAPIALAGGITTLYAGILSWNGLVFRTGIAVSVASLVAWLILLQRQGRTRAAGWQIPAALVIGPLIWGGGGAMLGALSYDPNDTSLFNDQAFLTIVGAILGALLGTAVGFLCAIGFAIAHVRQVMLARRASVDAADPAPAELTVVV